MKSTQVVLVVAICSAALAQSLKLSEPFSRSAVTALRAINATGWRIPASIHELEARQADAQSKMDEAKQAAQSQDDADAFVYLQRYQLQHSQNFADYSNAVTRTASKMTGKDSLQRAAEAVAKDPKFIARRKKEMNCAAALEKKLQSRVFSAPSICELY
jgi:hypothetical protein